MSDPAVVLRRRPFLRPGLERAAPNGSAAGVPTQTRIFDGDYHQGGDHDIGSTLRIGAPHCVCGVLVALEVRETIFISL